MNRSNARKLEWRLNEFTLYYEQGIGLWMSVEGYGSFNGDAVLLIDIRGEHPELVISPDIQEDREEVVSLKYAEIGRRLPDVDQ
jgi:hypothetical protein